MKALGIDSGTKSCGYGVVVRDGPVWDFIECGEVANSLAELRGLIVRVRPAIIGVEGVKVMRLAAAKQLLGTQDASTRALCAAEVEGVAAHVFYSDDWRRLLGVPKKGTDTTDARVEKMLRFRLRGMLGPHKTNSHERDGLGLALCAGIASGGRR